MTQAFPVFPLSGFLAFLGEHDRPGALIAVFGAYSDESGTHDGSPIMTVAMYLGRREAWDAFENGWAADVLLNGRLSYFHMKELVGAYAHGFELLTPDERIQVVSAAVRLIVDHTTVRVGSAINVADYERHKRAFGAAHPKLQLPSAYTFGVIDCLKQIAHLSTIQSDWITYVLESGHTNCTEALEHLGMVYNDAEMREQYRIATFLPGKKKEIRPLQAADLYAYSLREFALAKYHDPDTPQHFPQQLDALGSRDHFFNYWNTERLENHSAWLLDVFTRLRAQYWEYEREKKKGRGFPRP